MAYGNTTIQIQTTEDYSASGGIAMYSANGSGANMTSSGQDGSMMSIYHISWQWDSDGDYTNDGFTGHGWFAGTGPLSGYASAEAVTRAAQDGVNIANLINTWASDSTTSLNEKDSWIQKLRTDAVGCIS